MTPKGFRGALEVKLANGYVADAVALGNLQNKYNVNYWNNHHGDPKMNHFVHERHHEQVFILEAKATRTDFLNTFGSLHGEHRNRFQPIGTHHWVVVAADIITPEDMEKLRFWGVLVESGNGLKEIRPPYWCNIDKSDIHKIAYRILWRKGRLMKNASDEYRFT